MKLPEGHPKVGHPLTPSTEMCAGCLYYNDKMMRQLKGPTCIGVPWSSQSAPPAAPSINPRQVPDFRYACIGLTKWRKAEILVHKHSKTGKPQLYVRSYMPFCQGLEVVSVPDMQSTTARHALGQGADGSGTAAENGDRGRGGREEESGAGSEGGDSEGLREGPGGESRRLWVGSRAAAEGAKARASGRKDDEERSLSDMSILEILDRTNAMSQRIMAKSQENAALALSSFRQVARDVADLLGSRGGPGSR
ncbi:unnamed protein product [Pedinophyceae sp. YPF-701]|nr:unnamed protein product [Pedinophyceae sp. YPF-701]